MQNHEYGHATRRPYAHARASSMLPVLVEELLLLDPGKLRKLARSARREANRTRWRNRVQQRCSKISAGIAAARRALGDQYAGRRRQPDGTWLMLVELGEAQMTAIEVKPKPIASFDDFERSIELRVLVPDLVDCSALEAELERINVAWGRGK